MCLSFNFDPTISRNLLQFVSIHLLRSLLRHLRTHVILKRCKCTAENASWVRECGCYFFGVQEPNPNWCFLPNIKHLLCFLEFKKRIRLERGGLIKFLKAPGFWKIVKQVKYKYKLSLLMNSVFITDLSMTHGFSLLV